MIVEIRNITPECDEVAIYKEMSVEQFNFLEDICESLKKKADVDDATLTVRQVGEYAIVGDGLNGKEHLFHGTMEECKKRMEDSEFQDFCNDCYKEVWIQKTLD